MSLAKDLSVIFTICHLTIISSGQAAVEKNKHNPERFTIVKDYKTTNTARAERPSQPAAGNNIPQIAARILPTRLRSSPHRNTDALHHPINFVHSHTRISGHSNFIKILQPN